MVSRQVSCCDSWHTPHASLPGTARAAASGRVRPQLRHAHAQGGPSVFAAPSLVRATIGRRDRSSRVRHAGRGRTAWILPPSSKITGKVEPVLLQRVAHGIAAAIARARPGAPLSSGGSAIAFFRNSERFVAVRAGVEEEQQHHRFAARGRVNHSLLVEHRGGELRRDRAVARHGSSWLGRRGAVRTWASIASNASPARRELRRPGQIALRIDPTARRRSAVELLRNPARRIVDHGKSYRARWRSPSRA